MSGGACGDVRLLQTGKCHFYRKRHLCAQPCHQGDRAARRQISHFLDRAQLGAAPRSVACGARMQLRDISRLYRGIGSIGRAVGTAFARGYRRMLPQLEYLRYNSAPRRNRIGMPLTRGAVYRRCSAVGGAYPHRHGARRYRYPLLIRAQGTVRHRLRLSYRLARSRFDGASTSYRGRQRYCLCRAEHARIASRTARGGNAVSPCDRIA